MTEKIVDPEFIACTFLNTYAAANYLNVSVSTMKKFRKHNEGPEYFRFGRSIRYYINDLHEWAIEQRDITNKNTDAYKKKQQKLVDIIV